MLNLRARVTGSVPCQRQVRDRIFAFYDRCAQHDDIPRAQHAGRDHRPVGGRDHRRGDRRDQQPTAESLNRLAKLEARLAYGFSNHANQRRRVRIAFTRGYPRRSRTATPQEDTFSKRT